MNFKAKVLSFILFVFITTTLYSQQKSKSISGKVVDENGVPIVGVTVFIKKLNKGTATGLNGNFELKNIKVENCVVTITAVGYNSQAKKVSFKNEENLYLKITMKQAFTVIDEVTVRAKTQTEKIEEKSFAVKSVDIKKLKNKSTDAAQILNSVSGVRIRTEGGVGSDYNLSLNGLSGNQIRIFIDDMPIDELGQAFGLNNIAVNLIERIDVYKGVVPISLGADALGGAINIITDKKKNSFIDASYSIGSFNTHKATLNSKYRSEKSGFTVNLSGVYNYSDNNYTMYDLDYFKQIDGVETEVTGDVDRFHDGFKSISGNVGVGFTKTNWADVFLIDYNKSKINNEIQGIIGRAIGEATEEEENTTYRFKYTNNKLFNKKLKVDLFTFYNDIASIRIDTSSNRYRWNGTYTVNPSQDGQGEFLFDKTIYKYNQQQFTSRIFLDYKLAKNHNISFNHIYSDTQREGENRINAEENQPFQSPNYLTKTVTGLSYTSSFIENKLQNTIAGKYYYFDILAKEAINFSDGSIGIDDIATTQKNIGYSISSRYLIQPNFHIKASYERGYRIPLPIEIFGDGLSVLANPNLQPEISNNLNIGLSHNLKTGSGFFKNEMNLFQRDVKNFIRLKFLGLVNSYDNEPDILIQGIEYDFEYQNNKFNVKGNLTWQNVLNNQDFEAGSVLEQLYEKEQIPNTPFLFGNVAINYKLPNLFKNINSSIYYDINYVEEFYLNYKNVATLNPDKNTIPTQFLNNIGTTFSTKNKKHHINIEVQNLFNQVAFDNFKQQKPSRGFYLKYRFSIDH